VRIGLDSGSKVGGIGGREGQAFKDAIGAHGRDRTAFGLRVLRSRCAFMVGVGRIPGEKELFPTLGGN